MTFNKNAIDILWITCNAFALDDYGDFDIGEPFPGRLILFHTEIEPSESAVKSFKRVDVNLYEGVGRIFDLSKENGPMLLFDCGIYAYASYNTRQDLTFPEGIESGSYVKMRFYLFFDEGYDSGMRLNGEPILRVIPEMQYDLIVKDILVLVEDDKYFNDLPVAYTSNNGDIYKRLKKTRAFEDCGGDAKYVFICQVL